MPASQAILVWGRCRSISFADISGGLVSGWLIGLEIVDLPFLAARRYGHAYASAAIWAAGGTVPAFFIGIDQVAIFAMDQAGAGDQCTDIAVNIEPDLLHVLVEMTPAGVGRQLCERR